MSVEENKIEVLPILYHNMVQIGILNVFFPGDDLVRDLAGASKGIFPAVDPGFDAAGVPDLYLDILRRLPPFRLALGYEAAHFAHPVEIQLDKGLLYEFSLENDLQALPALFLHRFLF